MIKDKKELFYYLNALHNVAEDLDASTEESLEVDALFLAAKLELIAMRIREQIDISKKKS